MAHHPPGLDGQLTIRRFGGNETYREATLSSSVSPPGDNTELQYRRQGIV